MFISIVFSIFDWKCAEISQIDRYSPPFVQLPMNCYRYRINKIEWIVIVLFSFRCVRFIFIKWSSSVCFIENTRLSRYDGRKNKPVELRFEPIRALHRNQVKMRNLRYSQNESNEYTIHEYVQQWFMTITNIITTQKKTHTERRKQQTKTIYNKKHRKSHENVRMRHSSALSNSLTSRPFTIISTMWLNLNYCLHAFIRSFGRPYVRA